MKEMKIVTSKTFSSSSESESRTSIVSVEVAFRLSPILGSGGAMPFARRISMSITPFNQELAYNVSDVTVRTNRPIFEYKFRST